MSKRKLRMIWIIPNVFCYLMCIAVFIFVFANMEGLKEIGETTYWMFVLFALLFVSVFGSLRIRKWIMKGEL